MDVKTGKQRRYVADLVFGPVPDDMDIDLFAAQQHGVDTIIDRETRMVTILPNANAGRSADA